MLIVETIAKIRRAYFGQGKSIKLICREIFNAEWFSTVEQARTIIGIWLKQYNQIRPHQSLGMRPPLPETPAQNGP
ncbi:MAG TPA: integrase core domain-containing protein [Parvularculaceae bacterium]|nr:integrase core domain-containing protein [Parvularculaceae bacterium]